MAWFELVLGVIERGNAADVFHCASPRETAWMVTALSDAYALHAQTGGGVPAAEMVRITWRLTEHELGLAPGTLAAG